MKRDRPTSQAGTAPGALTEKALIKAPVEFAVRPLIDDAIHSVIAAAAARLNNGALFRCADYAIVGAWVLRKLTGHPYLAVAGRSIVDCGGGQFLVFAPPRAERRRATSLSQVSRYHCWIEALHRVADGSSRLEWIDFTVRHDWAAAEALGVPFTRQPRKYLWEWSDVPEAAPPELRKRIGADPASSGWMSKDLHCTRLLRRYEREFKTAFEKLTSLAIIQFCDQLAACSSSLPALR